VLIATAAMAAHAVGCASVADQQLARIARSLELTVVRARVTDSRDGIELDLSLRNRGNSAAVACLGPGRSVSSSAGAGMMTLVDHPGCVREFTIPPGEAMTWSERLDTQAPSEAGAGQDVQVEVEIEIVNPRRCGSFGCSSTWLKPAAVRIPAHADLQ
jgi:hypothetical protein